MPWLRGDHDRPRQWSGRPRRWRARRSPTRGRRGAAGSCGRPGRRSRPPTPAGAGGPTGRARGRRSRRGPHLHTAPGSEPAYTSLLAGSGNELPDPLHARVGALGEADAAVGGLVPGLTQVVGASDARPQPNRGGTREQPARRAAGVDHAGVDLLHVEVRPGPRPVRPRLVGAPDPQTLARPHHQHRLPSIAPLVLFLGTSPVATGSRRSARADHAAELPITASALLGLLTFGDSLTASSSSSVPTARCATTPSPRDEPGVQRERAAPRPRAGTPLRRRHYVVLPGPAVSRQPHPLAARQPSSFPVLKHPVALRLLLGALIDPAAITAMLREHLEALDASAPTSSGTGIAARRPRGRGLPLPRAHRSWGLSYFDHDARSSRTCCSGSGRRLSRPGRPPGRPPGVHVHVTCA